MEILDWIIAALIFTGYFIAVVFKSKIELKRVGSGLLFVGASVMIARWTVRAFQRGDIIDIILNLSLITIFVGTAAFVVISRNRTQAKK